MSLLHPGLDDSAELGHLKQGFFGNSRGRDVALDGGKFRLRELIVIVHPMDAAKDF